jgi:hypothetical protein
VHIRGEPAEERRNAVEGARSGNNEAAIAVLV